MFGALAPFWRGQSGPAQAARNQVLTVIPDDTEKRVIGLENSTFEIGNEDPNDVGVDQTPNLSFAIFEVAIKPRILERDRGLRRQHLQHRDALGRENARSQIVFKIENTDEFSLVDQWQTKYGTGATLADVGIGSKRILRRCIVENHGLLRAHCVTNQRLRQHGWSVSLLSQLHDHILSASGRFRIDVQLFTPRCNQQPSLGAGLLDRRAHELVDELFQHYLAGNGLRHIDHGREIELFDRCFDRARWTRRALVLPQPRMQLIELPHLSVGAPTQIAPPRVSQVEMRNLLEAARGVKAGSQLVGERLVVDKAASACRRYGALVQVHGLERTPLDPGNLGSDQRCTILEVLRTIRRPGPKLSRVRPKCFSMLGVRVGAQGLAPCGAAQASIEMALRLL